MTSRRSSVAANVPVRREACIRTWRPRPWLAAVALSASLSNPALAEEIFRWVDEAGVVHYSDTRPHDDVPVTVVEIESSQRADYDPSDDPYSILNQARRTHQIWLDYEAARQARARDRLDALAYGPLPPSPDRSAYEYSSYSYYPIWPAPGPDDGRRYRRDQLNALDALDLLGPRPQSINSGTHQDRATRSQLLPIVPPPAPPPRPEPP